MNSLTKFFSLSWRRKWLLVRTFLVLAMYKCLLFIFPFNKFLNVNPKPGQRVTALPDDKLTNTVWAIQVVSNRVPLGFTCLVQALSAKWLVNNHPDVRVCIGVHKSVHQGFSAHAWVVYKDRIILGEQDNQVFEPILDWN